MKYEVFELIPYAGHDDKFVLERWMDFDKKEKAADYVQELNGSRKFTILEVY